MVILTVLNGQSILYFHMDGHLDNIEWSVDTVLPVLNGQSILYFHMDGHLDSIEWSVDTVLPLDGHTIFQIYDDVFPRNINMPTIRIYFQEEFALDSCGT